MQKTVTIAFHVLSTETKILNKDREREGGREREK